MSVSFRRIFLLALLPLAPATPAAAPKRVLLLFPFALSRPASLGIIQAIRGVFDSRLPAQVDILPDFVVPGENEVKWLIPKYQESEIDLIIAISDGSVPAAVAFRRERPTPIPLLVDIDVSNYRPAVPAIPGAVRMESDLRHLESVRTALSVTPKTRHIAVISGNSSVDRLTQKLILPRLHEAFPKLDIIDLSALSLDDLRRRTAALPPNSICLLANFEQDASVTKDGGGISLSRNSLAQVLSASSNAPLFDTVDTSFGAGVVGGWMASIPEIGADVARVALRMLQGEAAESIGLIRKAPGSYRFDDRQLRRWKIDRRLLPAGSSVEFVEPTVWQRYRSLFVFALGAGVALVGLLVYLVVERWRRERSHAEFRRRALTGEHDIIALSHWNRVASLGELASSLAHELNQPLTAIIANTEVVKVMLENPAPDLVEIRNVLADVQNDSRRAASVIRDMRGLLRKNPSDAPVPTDVSAAVRDTLRLVENDAAQRDIRLEACLTAHAIASIGRTQLQQVILNLLNNALDASETGAPGGRWVAVRVSSGSEGIIIEVEDSGPGVPPDQQQRIFEPFVTTKPQGLGIGLSISRSIVLAAGGHISGAVGQGGALFRVQLPASG